MIDIRFNRAAGIAAAALLAFAFPAQASNRTNDNSSRPAAASPSNRADNANSQRRICVRQALPGTRIIRNYCKTAAEWEAIGGLEAPER